MIMVQVWLCDSTARPRTGEGFELGDGCVHIRCLQIVSCTIEDNCWPSSALPTIRQAIVYVCLFYRLIQHETSYCQELSIKSHVRKFRTLEKLFKVDM